ncbi:hypothetical protein Pyn_38813 [Prunus yedoensis var. nudiflora]|uniref:Uncharacterized protein n=1 Tax=Prunus yedoensis var. nudiflora TaxID=2094558 RepID=A0A314Z245_PRUYE|nr:hypothetical protein Pyn_38813 [Prunus yedoensis var. nudiflora]
MGFRVEPSLRIRRRTISCCCCSRHSRRLRCLHLTCPNRLLPIRPDPPVPFRVRPFGLRHRRPLQK